MRGSNLCSPKLMTLILRCKPPRPTTREINLLSSNYTYLVTSVTRCTFKLQCYNLLHNSRCKNVCIKNGKFIIKPFQENSSRLGMHSIKSLELCFSANFEHVTYGLFIINTPFLITTFKKKYVETMHSHYKLLREQCQQGITIIIRTWNKYFNRCKCILLKLIFNM